VVLDHRSRAVLAMSTFATLPTAAHTCALLDDAVRRAGRAPRSIVSDRGVQFASEYRAWCERNGVRPRFGAVGRHGSIAIVERFIRSLKYEGMRRIVVPFGREALQAELDAYAAWYNEHRPHQSLNGSTPNEILAGGMKRERIETRDRKAAPPKARLARGLEVVVHRHEQRAHLPIVELREAA
jgi:putative transposase